MGMKTQMEETLATEDEATATIGDSTPLGDRQPTGLNKEDPQEDCLVEILEEDHPMEDPQEDGLNLMNLLENREDHGGTLTTTEPTVI